jgi:hypothetical protein
MVDKAESRRIRVEIRRVFLRAWDPIGVRNAPNAQDEYDGYIGRIYELLVGGAPDKEVIDYLFWAVHEHMGLEGGTRDDMPPTLAELKKINLSPADDAAGAQQ